MNADVLFGHSAACGFFATIFRPGLDADLLRRCARDHVAEFWPLCGTGDDARAALATLRGVFADLNDAALALIERDNTVLFIGPENPVPMWESVWTTKDRLLFADCTDDVRQAFAEAGLEAPNDGREPADHLAFELAFLSVLLARAVKTVEAGDEAQGRRHFEVAAAFFNGHLANWAGDCLAEIGERAGTDFYRGTAALCADTLTGLREIFAAGA
jgi:TorA maturation chaperone TorD